MGRGRGEGAWGRRVGDSGDEFGAGRVRGSAARGRRRGRGWGRAGRVRAPLVAQARHPHVGVLEREKLRRRGE